MLVVQGEKSNTKQAYGHQKYCTAETRESAEGRGRESGVVVGAETQEEVCENTVSRP